MNIGRITLIDELSFGIVLSEDRMLVIWDEDGEIFHGHIKYADWNAEVFGFSNDGKMYL